MGSENRIARFLGGTFLQKRFAEMEGLTSRKANENDQNRRSAGLLQGWQFWKDQEEDVAPDQIAGSTQSVANLLREGLLDPRKLPMDANGNFILPDGSTLTRGELKALLYGGTQEAEIALGDSWTGCPARQGPGVPAPACLRRCS